MLDRSPFLQFTAPRLQKVRQTLDQLAWKTEPEPLRVARSEPRREHLPVAAAEGLDYRPVTETPHHWGELFDQCFWKVDLSGRDTAGRFLVWRDQGEATAYVDETPIFGIDPGHPRQPLPEGIDELRIESVCSRSGIWVTGEAQGTDPEGSRFEGAFLATRDEDAWALRMDFDVLLDLAFMLITKRTHADNPGSTGGYRTPFDDADPLVKVILAGLDRAADRVDEGDLPAARAASAELMHKLTGRGFDLVHNVLTGHAHIDLVWLWPESVADFKATHSFANALSLMDRYPELVFGYSQPASYDAIDRRAPRLMEQVQRRAQEGRFEHAGATYVESDTQLPCGENLLRAFEVGQRDLVERFGGPSNVLWIPDVFGYAPCLPQLMKGFGVEYFYTTKLHWSSATQFPYSSFRWRGHDGAEVLTHISYSHYNQTATPRSLHHFADHHRQAAVHDESLVPTGYGDGGGGVTEEMCERVRRQADLAGVPRSRWGRIDAFFDRMAEKRDSLPVHRGEIYLEYHRGVHTTHVNLKAAFRAAERGLQTWEAAHAVLGRGEIDPWAWKRLIFAQFHDHIPGSSIQRVYDEGVPELENLAERGREEAGLALSEGGGEDRLFNPLPLPVRRRTDDAIVELPPLSGVSLRDASRVGGRVEASETSLKSDRVEAEFDRRGEITRLVVDGHAISVTAGRTLGEVWTFPDHPTTYDAWDIDRHTLANGVHERGDAKVQLQRRGDHAATLSFTRGLTAGCAITVSYTLEAGSPVLAIDCDVDWLAPQRLLKLAFPTDYQGTNARYGAPYGAALRPQLPGPLANDARFEVPGSRWAAVCDDTERDGLMLVTKHTYGFGCTSGLLHVSLVRSAKVTQPNVAGSTTSLPSTADAEISDLGRHRVSLAVGRYHDDAPRHENPAALADTLFTEPVAYRGPALASPLPAFDGGESLVPAWVKPTDNGYLLRLHETLGRRGTCTLTAARGAPLRHAELPGEATSEPGHALRIDYRPYQLVTVRVDRG